MDSERTRVTIPTSSASDVSSSRHLMSAHWREHVHGQTPCAWRAHMRSPCIQYIRVEGNRKVILIAKQAMASFFAARASTSQNQGRESDEQSRVGSPFMPFTPPRQVRSEGGAPLRRDALELISHNARAIAMGPVIKATPQDFRLPAKSSTRSPGHFRQSLLPSLMGSRPPPSRTHCPGGEGLANDEDAENLPPVDSQFTTESTV